MAFTKQPAWVYVLVGLVIGVGLVVGYQYWQSQTPTHDDYHVHADFGLFINGEKFNFAQEKYMSTNQHRLAAFVHLHDMQGDVIHVHQEGITLGDFITSIGMKLETVNNEITLTLDNGTKYSSHWFGCHVTDNGPFICVDPMADATAWRLFVNGNWVEETKFENYVLQDLDRVALLYGRIGDDATPLLNQVTDNACIQSGKCPERGEPSDESTCTSTGCAAGPIAGA